MKTKPTTIDTLGARILATRKDWGWSQGELARALGCDQACISFWERDKFLPSGTARVALSALFGCSVEQLVDGPFEIPAEPAQLPCFPLAEAVGQ